MCSGGGDQVIAAADREPAAERIDHAIQGDVLGDDQVAHVRPQAL
jgi:hypothetical protein